MSNYIIKDGELYHHGVKGMKWGVRRYQNKDGSLTAAGKKRHISTADLEQAKANTKAKKKAYKEANREYNKAFDKAYNRAISAYSPFKKHREANDRRWEKAGDAAEASKKAKAAYKSARKAEKALKKMEKIQAKEVKKQYEQQYMRGESAVGKVYAKLTGSHKIYADLAYELNDRKFEVIKPDEPIAKKHRTS